MRSALAVPLLLSCAVACCGRQSPELQPRPTTFTSSLQDSLPESASLVRRLAEAADGFRDGKDKYVVANRKFPHHVAGVFSTLDEARFVANRAGPDYSAFGPFRTIDDPPDQSSVGDEAVAEVIVVTKGGKRTRFPADSVDALFWSLAAFDKFVVPYLAVVYSAQYAAEQRELYRQGKTPFAHSSDVGHWRGSF
jgi:hypothetical protein